MNKFFTFFRNNWQTLLVASAAIAGGALAAVFPPYALACFLFSKVFASLGPTLGLVATYATIVAGGSFLAGCLGAFGCAVGNAFAKIFRGKSSSATSSTATSLSSSADPDCEDNEASNSNSNNIVQGAECNNGAFRQLVAGGRAANDDQKIRSTLNARVLPLPRVRNSADLGRKLNAGAADDVEDRDDGLFHTGTSPR